MYYPCNLHQSYYHILIMSSWRIELLKKQEEATITNKSITILLHNILPAHVGKTMKIQGTRSFKASNYIPYIV